MSFFGCFGGSKVLNSPKKIWRKEPSNNTRAVRFKTALELIIVLRSLCLVLGVDFKFTLQAAHPGFNENMMSKNISKKAIKRLTALMYTLQEIKIQRVHKLQELARILIALWNSLDTPTDGQQSFHIVARHIASSEHEITEPYILSLDFLNDVEAEVSRLEGLKSTKMNELVSRKKKELKELRRCSHLLVDTDAEMEESGATDPQVVLERIEAQISKVKEESFSRAEIVSRADKWLSACKEESRLERYNRGEIVYTSTKGPDYVLKRVERANAIVSKIPEMMETLTSKIIAWEKEKGIEFKYDGLHLLSMLENYAISKEEKEKEGNRKMKSQGVVEAEGVVFFGDEQSPTESAMQRPNINIEENGRNPDLLLFTKPVNSAKTADDLYMPSHGTVGCSNSENVRSECGKLEHEIRHTIPNSNNTSWVFVCEKEAEEKRVSLAASNSNNDKWVFVYHKEKEENKSLRKVTNQSPKCNWSLEEEENDNPFRDYF